MPSNSLPAQVSAMREVSQEDFFKRMNPLNVHPSAQGGEHSLSIWKLRGQETIGASCNTLNQYGRTLYPVQRRYFLNR